MFVFLLYVDKTVSDVSGDRSAESLCHPQILLDVGCECKFSKIVISHSNGIRLRKVFFMKSFES